jgi:SPP1 family predicted phage head-tail adaptor
MSLDPGTLNSRVLLQKRGTERDAAGQPVETWSTVAKVWANIRNRSGSEVIRADAVVSQVRASIRIRKRSDVNAAMRVVSRGTVYQIHAVLPDEAWGDHIDLVCEVVNG